jgi:hypothetical protein
MSRDAHHQSRQRDQSAGEYRIDENDREGNSGRGQVENWEYDESDERSDGATANCGNDDRPQLSDACMTPQSPVHPGAVENQQPEWYREQKVQSDEPEIVGYPPRFLEPYEECDQRSENYRQSVGDEQVPVTE